MEKDYFSSIFDYLFCISGLNKTQEFVFRNEIFIRIRIEME